MGFGLAVKAFFAALKNDGTAERVAEALNGGPTAKNGAVPALENAKETKKGGDSTVRRGGSDATSALALLAALQREARFVDFIKESLDGVDDAAVGAAARNVRDRCASALERFFEIRPALDAEEGTAVEIDAETAKNPVRLRVLGRSAEPDADGKVAGRLVHAGWVAKKAAPPVWAGAPEDAAALAPIEIE
ncbi:MAG: DUF2760 domain-containing protein [Thermoguttaceae bacterium]|nr:DUF2760 domain-containing protein [Thermoguttaceae bacterium]